MSILEKKPESLLNSNISNLRVTNFTETSNFDALKDGSQFANFGDGQASQNDLRTSELMGTVVTQDEEEEEDSDE